MRSSPIYIFSCSNFHSQHIFTPPSRRTPAQGMPRFYFIGDGLYVGDGGLELQRLWERSHWRAIRNCDGRYTSRERSLAKLDLSTLCEKFQLASTSSVTRCRSETDGHDAVDVVRLYGGGGVLTYVKQSDAGVTSYVHTLNTESGLARKMSALGCTHVLSRSLMTEAQVCFTALCTLLDSIPENERTRSAPSVAVAMRYYWAKAATRLFADMGSDPIVMLPGGDLGPAPSVRSRPLTP
jgi:hypothetical protein